MVSGKWILIFHWHWHKVHKIKIELFPNVAPNAVNSFIHLLQKGCFDQRHIERIVGRYPGFGRVISGFEKIERLPEVEIIPMKANVPGVVINEPKNPEIMVKVNMETFGCVFEPPVKVGTQV
jgi:cyclophilin family peptidyl-prolyl cis-trans isomerase